ncbi:phospholipase D family protein [Maribius pontilimi]|uniref:Phospholipase D family protein n=1 Tax=Palleronia pontilimi TaxID=1964209 RepID=A0A934IKN5_9RHOB|nr:phospholipase D family protein [Palleronia pontilimi]MBJ3764315.1 phospholipase D family protein [Palleronia pontilimi]
MSGAVENWAALSFLEGLRPGPGESAELALLASYSADLGSIGATLLALAGKDTDAGRGSPSDFADAVERLRGKARIVIQRGRLAKMRRTPRIAAVLDQFVREVDFDEATHSWHPKVALVRTRNTTGETGWRLWIGSRNLTENVNRDIGLLLVSGTKGGALIAGADEMARALAERAELKGLRPASLAATIAKVAWRSPAGVRVERIRWSAGTGDQPVPVPPPDVDEVIVVSPFIDKQFLARQLVKGTKQSRRVLLTTVREIERIGPSLAAFDDLLALDAPDYPVGDPELESRSAEWPSDVTSTEDEEEEVGRGLHAKLLFMRTGRKRTLWLGSANATLRAWTGRNAEATAELVVTEPVERGLKALLGSARLVDAPSGEHLPDAEVLEEEALERARAQVAARWSASLRINGEGIRLSHRSDLHPDGPHPDEADILLEVGALHGDLLIWPPRQADVHLGHVVPSDRSELVRLRVSRKDKGLSWLQRAPAEPPFGEDRDRAAFVRFLGARGFLLWVAGLLANDDTQSDGDWTIDEPRERTSEEEKSTFDSSLPTLEAMLAAWARDPVKFREIERRVSQYLPAVLEQAEQEDKLTAEMLRSFKELWSKLRTGLGSTEVKGRSR